MERIVKNDLEYWIDEEKGVVVCKIYDCHKIPLNRIYKYTGINYEPSDEQYWRYIIDYMYVGVAKCAKEDTFNKETGMKIALTKAKIKRGRAINRAVAKFIEDQVNTLKTLTMYGLHAIPQVEEED